MQSLSSPEIQAWLTKTASQNGNYRHLRLVEDVERREDAIQALRIICKEVHKDAKRYLTQLTQNSLDPLGVNSPSAVANAYPRLLHLNTRKAYFGEIMAGIVIENFSLTQPGDWRVPVFLFRYHQMAFDQLERWRETNSAPIGVPGQTGDDCLAFHVGPDGRVIATFVGEGKCTKGHESSMISDAHRKVSTSELRPLSLSRAIGILNDQVNDSEAAEWSNVLQELYNRRDLSDNYKRADLVSYTCGQKPKMRTNWAPIDQPHQSYSGGRELECVEIHLTNIDELVEKVYTY